MSTTRTFSYANESSDDGSSVEVYVTRDDFPVSLVVDNGDDDVGAVALTVEEAEALAKALLLAATTADANDADDDDDCGECPSDDESPDDDDYAAVELTPALANDLINRRTDEAERRENARFDAALLRSYNEDGDDIDFDLDEDDDA